jgi:hypothetical protein
MPGLPHQAKVLRSVKLSAYRAETAEPRAIRKGDEKMTDAKIKELALSSWASLNANLMRLSLVDIKRAIELELEAGRRPTYVRRLVKRQGRLERAEKNRELDKLLGQKAS